MRKTKIICTLGPATDKDDNLKQMVLAGMNVARLNFSHADHEEHKIRMDQVKAVREELDMPVGIMLDTKGPEIRIKTFVDGKIELAEGQKFTLTTREIEGTNEIVSITYTELPKDVSVGTRILIDDGLIELIVESIVDDTDVICTVKNSGPLSNRKSVNVPGISLSLPYMSEKDKGDIIFGIGQGIDFIAASFVRKAQDVRDIKAILEAHNATDIQIIAKIENMEGVNNVDEILEEVAGIMVARGDLGVEVEFVELPRIQKHLIKKAIARGKRVVTATQMLESMAKNPRPTRAEASDVANAVYDGTSAIMLSGETSVGKYPVLTVATMSDIALRTENTIDYNRRRVTRPEFTELSMQGEPITAAIAHATCTVAADVHVKAIVAFTESGYTARAVSSFRPSTLIIGCTPSKKTFHRLSMSWGIMPVLANSVETLDGIFHESKRCAKELGVAEIGDAITITAGIPVGVSNFTNMLRVLKIKD